MSELATAHIRSGGQLASLQTLQLHAHAICSSHPGRILAVRVCQRDTARDEQHTCGKLVTGTTKAFVGAIIVVIMTATPAVTTVRPGIPAPPAFIKRTMNESSTSASPRLSRKKYILRPKLTQLRGESLSLTHAVIRSLSHQARGSGLMTTTSSVRILSTRILTVLQFTFSHFHRPTEQILHGDQVHLYQGFSKVKSANSARLFVLYQGGVIGPMPQ